MGLHDLPVDRPLAEIRLAELSAKRVPFDLIAPLAAWYFASTAHRACAEAAFRRLKRQAFEALAGCKSLDDVPRKGNARLLANAYHRALLETAATVLPDWRLSRDGDSRFALTAPTNRALRAAGEQFGMLAVFAVRRDLIAHLRRGKPFTVASRPAPTAANPVGLGVRSVVGRRSRSGASRDCGDAPVPT